MMPYRTSLAALLTAIAILAVGIACLLNASEAWSVTLRVVNTVLLLLIPLAAVLHRGRARTAWAGFATFGWAYLLLSSPAFEQVDAVVHPTQLVRSSLIGLDLVRKYPPPTVGARVDVMDYSKQPSAYVRGTAVREYAKGCFEIALDDGRKASECLAAFRMDNREYYLSVGNTLACLLFGLLGSASAYGFKLARRRP